MSTLRFIAGVRVHSSGAKRATLGWACEEAATLCAQVVGEPRSRSRAGRCWAPPCLAAFTKRTYIELCRPTHPDPPTLRPHQASLNPLLDKVLKVGHGLG